MKRILFVDDEPQVLSGLRALLRPQRDEWEMSFAPGGEAALAELQRAPFDVIVTDMVMPGIDGATLLRRVQAQHPGVVRIVLSGYTEFEAALRTIPVAHQFLLKPCDPVVLRRVVRRACDLQETLQDPALRGVVGSLDTLPTLPETYVELTRLLMDENVRLQQIARLVEGDAALSAKVLQLVNSAFIGIGREIASIEQAVTYLGITMLKNLTLAIQVFRTDGLDKTQQLALHRLQRHGLLVGGIARRLAGGDRAVADDAFMAGILHDIGKLVLLRQRPEQFQLSQTRAESERRPSEEIELEVFGVSHAEVGGYLLGIWGLPYPVIEAVAHHHLPRRVALPSFPDPLSAVYLADYLAHELEVTAGVGTSGAPPILDEEFVDALGVRQHLPAWREMAAAQTGPTRSRYWSDHEAA